MSKFFAVLEKVGQKLGAEPGKAMAVPEMEMVREILDILLAAYGFTKTKFVDIQKAEIIETTLNQITTNWGISANTLANERIEN